MIIKVNQSGRTEYGIRQFYLDTPSDLESLKSVDCKAGSSAVVISTGQAYVKNSQDQWILQPTSASPSPGPSPDPSNTYIWDGGLIQ